jgi:hypothetical protein
VEVGERASTTDYVAPPEMLSVERTIAEGFELESAFGAGLAQARPKGGEINISLGTYVRRDVVASAFGVDDLPSSWSVAPNQPYPVDGRLYKWWAGFAALLLVLDFLLSNGFRKESVDQFFFFLSLGMMSVIPVGALIYRYFFESSRWSESAYSPYASWSTGDDD